ncbi:ABC transporter substrate-binding protein [Candidatus Lokiarchaeum ossiferum]|uniref:ABC transporter substrate-binding protein n=1 Tax=Candidatus Lokiarchaeum ossiferum TaxID=2951803 RepID=UPI00352C8AFC
MLKREQRIRVLGLALVLIFMVNIITPFVSADLTEDSYEENDTFGDAALLPYSGGNAYSLTLLDADDYFKITVGADEGFYITLSTNKVFILQLYDDNQILIKDSDEDSTSQYLYYYNSGVETNFTLRIYSPYSDYDDYSLYINSYYEDGYEQSGDNSNNNLIQNSTLINVTEQQDYTATLLDDDWYYFGLYPGDDLVVEVSMDWYYSNMGEHMDVVLYHYEYDYIEEGRYDVSYSTSFTAFDVEGGWYALKISSPSGGNFEYNMELYVISDDQYEENDEISQAAYLDVESQPNYERLALYDDTNDWFKMNLTEGENLRIEVNNGPYNWDAKFQVDLYDPNQNNIGGSHLFYSSLQMIDLPNLPMNGTYYLHIFSNDADPGSYNLHFYFYNEDSYEENDDIGQAYYKNLNIGDTWFGGKLLDSADWFKFNLTEGESINIECYFDYWNLLEKDIDIDLYGPGGLGDLLKSESGGDSYYRFSYSNSPTNGTYYIRIYSTSNDMGGYSLHTMKLFDDEYEPNDLFETATYLNHTETSTFYNLKSFNSDWYKFNFSESESVEFAVDFHGGAYVDLHIYDSSHNELASQNFYEDGSITFIGLPNTGEYYLYIDADTDENWQTYDLMINMISDDAYEENDDFGSSVWLNLTVSEEYSNLRLFDDEDWYSFTLNQGDHLSVGITFSDYTIFGMAIYGPGGLTDELYLAHQDSYSSDFTMYNVSTSGLYYIHICGYSEFDQEERYGTYQLSFSFIYDDEYEPNDDIGSAALLPVGVSNEYAWLLDSADWYKVNLTAGDNIAFRVRSFYKGNINLEFFGSAEIISFSSDYYYDEEKIVRVMNVDTTGDYYFKVNSLDGSMGLYEFGMFPIFDDYDSEENDDYTNAFHFTGDSISANLYDSADWFSFDLASDEVVNFHFEGNFPMGVEIYDSGMTLLDSSTDGNYYINFENIGVSTTGLVFIHIFSPSADIGEYQFDLTIIPDDALESNDDLSAAKMILLDQTYFLKLFDSHDYYILNISQMDILSIDFICSGFSGVEVEMFDRNFDKLDLKVMESSSSISAILTNVSYTGLYYLHIFNSDSQKWQYFLKVQQIEDDKYEENDDIYHAALLETNQEKELQMLDNNDWFMIECALFDNIQITLDDSNNLNLGLEFYDTNGALIRSAGDTFSKTTITEFAINQAGFYFIHVSCPTTSFGSYSLEVKNLVNDDLPVVDDDSILVVGATSLVVDLDPQFAWDSGSIDVISQVCEGLFSYNLSDPELSPIPQLAAGDGTWNVAGTEFTVPLKENVIFHDGTAFNAAAVKWSFDRLLNFVQSYQTQFAELYRDKTGQMIIAEVIVINEFTVQFRLNNPYSAFKGLLCFSGSYILSPSSTPLNSFLLSDGSDELIGTGPFKLIDIANSFLDFEANELYYQNTININEMRWKLFNSQDDLTAALLSGDVDVVLQVSQEYLEEIDNDPQVVLSAPIGSSVALYLTVDNSYFTLPMREAIAFAINRSYYYENIYDEGIIPLITPIPDGMLNSNSSLNYPIFNLTRSREILIDAGLAGSLTLASPDADWIDLAANSPIRSPTFVYNLGNIKREAIGYMLKDQLELIGMSVNVEGKTWGEFLDDLFNGNVPLAFLGWGADYNDPYNMLYYQYTAGSSGNYANVDDAYLQSLMDAALLEMDPILRNALYDEIQRYIVEDLHAYLYMGQTVQYSAWSNRIQGFQPNTMRFVSFKDCTYGSSFDLVGDNNDDFSNATPISLETGEFFMKFELFGNLNDEDWYCFNGSIGEIISILLDNTVYALNLELYSSDETLIASDIDGFGRSGVSTSLIGANDTFYLRVFSSESHYQQYSLGVKRLLDDEYENNNNDGEATPMDFGSDNSISGVLFNQDWYEIYLDLNAGVNIDFTFGWQFEEYPGFYIELYEADGTTLLKRSETFFHDAQMSGSVGYGLGGLCYDGAPYSGNYYVVIGASSYSGYVEYNVEFDNSSYWIDENEMNDLPTSATYILNQTTEYDGDDLYLTDSDIDWFYFEANVGEQIILQVMSERSPIDGLEVLLYFDDGSLELIQSFTAANYASAMIYWLIVETTGNYFLSINNNYDLTMEYYLMAMSDFDLNAMDTEEFEPNNSPGEAILIDDDYVLFGYTVNLTDSDWICVPGNIGDTFLGSMSILGENINVLIEIFAPDQVTLLASSYLPDISNPLYQKIMFEVIEEGNYYFKISAVENVAYLFMLDIYSVDQYDVVEAESGIRGNYLSWEFDYEFDILSIFDFDSLVNLVDIYVDSELVYESYFIAQQFDFDIYDLELLVGTYAIEVAFTLGNGNEFSDFFTLELVNVEPKVITRESVIYSHLYPISEGISWLPFDESIEPGLTSYSISQDGTEIQTGTWNSWVPISIDIASLPYGIYHFEIILNDGLGGTTLGEVTVWIIDENAMLITSPEDFIYQEQSTLNYCLEWYTFGDTSYSPTYTLYQDSVLIQSGIWSSAGNISVNISGLVWGIYEYTLSIDDGNGHSYSDTVNVIVNDEPIIDSPMDIDNGVASFTSSIQWTVYDALFDICNYIVFIDGVQNLTGSWMSNVPISFDISGLLEGDHMIRIEVYDGYGGMISDEVHVFVHPSDAPFITFHTGDLSYIDNTTEQQTISWALSDSSTLNPTYMIKLNGIIIMENQPWVSGQTYTYEVSGLSAGIYIFEFIFDDGLGRTAEFTVKVEVISSTSDTGTETLTVPETANPFEFANIPGFSPVYISLFGFLSIIVLFFKKKK